MSGIDTQSTWEAETVPASSNEFVLGQMLVDELKALGIENAWMDDKSYVFAKIPSNQDHPVPPVAFFAHLDTAPDESGANVNPRIIENWDGTDIVLNEDKQIILSKEEFPSLQNSIGKDLIVTDGNSLLGADDKAGVAEIMDAAEYLCTHPEFPHGDVLICFTPDEEIGNSTEYIPIENIPAKYGYTMDGGELGEINFETFNAATAIVTIHGTAIHPGEARGKMKNAILLANDFINHLPWRESPVNTDGYEGFYHVTDINGTVDRAQLTIALRDFTDEGYARRKQRVQEIADHLNQYYGENTFCVEVDDYYFNMGKEVEKYPEVKDYALKAMEVAKKSHRSFFDPRPVRIVSSISFMEFHARNIFMGSAIAPTPIYEYCTIQSMEKGFRDHPQYYLAVCEGSRKYHGCFFSHYLKSIFSDMMIETINANQEMYTEGR